MRHNVFLASLLMLMCWNLGVQAQINEIDGISCPGGTNGRLGVFPIFGTGPYTYSWNTGATDNIISGVSAGTYSVTVTDALLASQTFTYTIKEPSPITTAYVTIDNTFWPNPNGSITVTAAGGTGTFSYSLMDSLSKQEKKQVVNTFNSLYSGTYYMVITDVNGCQKYDTVSIGESAGLAVGLNLDYTACYNSSASSTIQPTLTSIPPIKIELNNNLITTIVAIVPGINPYVLSNGTSVSEISLDAYPGDNFVKIYDASNKGFRYAWTVKGATAPISIYVVDKKNNHCFNGNEGHLGFTANGGWGDYSYNVDGPASFSIANNIANNLIAGQYQLTATDSAGCSATMLDTITMPVEPLRIQLEMTPTYCPESLDGKILVSYVQGATYPVTYSWNTTETTAEIDSLWPGVYSVNVVDDYNCRASASAEVTPGNGVCVPNYITPNSDGSNDVLDISHLCAGPILSIKTIIFDNRGRLVFETNGCSTLWDGRDKEGNLLQSESVAFAEITLTKPNGDVWIKKTAITIQY